MVEHSLEDALSGSIVLEAVVEKNKN